MFTARAYTCFVCRSSSASRVLASIIYMDFCKKSLYKNGPKRGQPTLRGKVHATWARAVPVLGLFGDVLGTVWGTVSSATRQTPHHTTACGGIIIYFRGLAGG